MGAPELTSKLQRPEINADGLFSRARISSFFIALIQLFGLFYLIHAFQIERSSGLLQLFPFIIGAFILNSFAPVTLRPFIFLSLMLFSIYYAFGFFSGTIFIAVSFLILTVCHLSISFTAKISLILIIAAGMFILRAELFYAPRAALVVPFIASIFMFRIIIYLYEIKHKTITPSILKSLPYFFMYPNICFLFFPIIDYKTYVRTYNAVPDNETWQKGVRLILRGIIHILCYRFLYYYCLPGIHEVDDLGSFLQFTICTYSLIIRISGLFHLIIGLLCIFGFDLPPAFNNYFLSENFIDLWKRINTYWREFVLKIFFYPVFFRLKKRIPRYALPVTMMIVFFITWILHDYQLFWIRGTFTSLSSDITFWLIIGSCITINAVWLEKRIVATEQRNELTAFLFRMLRITGIFLFMSVMWGLWTSDNINQWFYLLTRSAKFGLQDLLFYILIFLLIIITGIGAQYLLKNTQVKKLVMIPPHHTLFLTLPCILLMCLLNFAASAKKFTKSTNTFLLSLSEDKPNRNDAEKKEQDYYVKLIDGEENRPSGLWEISLKRQKNNTSLGEAYQRTDDILTKVIKPNIKISTENYTFESNSFGLRDKEYTLSKPDNVLRIALLGGSYEMGSGVSNAEVFESIVETQMNNSDVGEKPIEILNFANGGFYLVQHVELCRSKIFAFNPDIVLYVAHSAEKDRMLTCVSSLIRQGKNLHYPFLENIKSVSGSKQFMSDDEIKGRLQPFADQLIKWSYMEMALHCKKNNAVAVWAFLPTIDDPEDSSEFESIRSYAQQLNYITLDMRGVYDSLDLSTIRISEWNSHPNAKGHRIIAERFYKELIKNKNLIFKDH
jgi:hypothetical protein